MSSYSLVRANGARTFSLLLDEEIHESFSRDDVFAYVQEDSVLPNGQRWRDLAKQLAANDEFFAIGIRKSFDADICYEILGAELSAEGARRYWEKIRSQLEQKPRIVAVVTATCILIFTLVAYASLHPSRTPTVLIRNYWFYDMNTGELFTARTTELPPIVAPSGSLPDGSLAGARAYVFSCGECDNEDKHFLAFIGVIRPNESKPLLRRPKDDEWVSMSSREGFELLDAARSRCSGDEKLTECFP